MFTHYRKFTEKSQKVPVNIRIEAFYPGAIKQGLVGPMALVPMPGNHINGGTNAEQIHHILRTSPQVEDEEDEFECPQLHIVVAVATFFLSAVLLFLCTDYVVNTASMSSSNTPASPQRL